MYLGISYTEFWDLSLAEYVLMCKEKVLQENTAYHHDYEIVRFEAFLILSYQSKLKDGTNVGDIYPFPWEKKKSQKKQSPEEMKRQIKQMALAFGTKPEQVKITPKKK